MRASDTRVLRPKVGTRFLLINTFVKFCVLKRNRETAQPISRVFSDERRRYRRVETAAQISTHRNIRTQANARGIKQQLQQLLRELIFFPAIKVRAWCIGNGPIGLNVKLVFLDRKRATRGQLEDILKRGPWRNGGPESENLVQAVKVDFSGDFRRGQKGFRSEEHTSELQSL